MDSFSSQLKKHKSTLKPVLKPVLYAVGVMTVWLSLLPMAQAQVDFLSTPLDQGIPDGRQVGGVIPGDCLAYQDLTALSPLVDGVVWSQTVNPQPNFYFHVPVPLTAAVPLEFIVNDSRGDFVFRKQFALETEPGVVFIPIEPSLYTTEGAVEAAPEFTIGETYRWTFSIYCDDAVPSTAISVSGTVKRVQNTVEAAGSFLMLGYADLMYQYAAAGIWHEALEKAIGLVYLQPFSATYHENLSSLLTQAGLEGLNPGPLQRFIPIE